ncbi:MAG: hypothetical protein QM675_11330 [Protaetiibacter sp.]
MRQVQLPPDAGDGWSECEQFTEETDHPTPEEVIASTVPSWAVGLALHLLLAAGLLAGAISRTHAPARRLAAGSRIA